MTNDCASRCTRRSHCWEGSATPSGFAPDFRSRLVRSAARGCHVPRQPCLSSTKRCDREEKENVVHFTRDCHAFSSLNKKAQRMHRFVDGRKT